MRVCVNGGGRATGAWTLHPRYAWRLPALPSTCTDCTRSCISKPISSFRVWWDTLLILSPRCTYIVPKRTTTAAIHGATKSANINVNGGTDAE